MKKRLPALLLALAVLVAALCGCSSNAGGTQGKANVVALHAISILGDEQRAEVYSDLLKSYTSRHKEVYLRDLTAVPADAFKLEATLNSTYTTTDAPHVVYYYNNTGILDIREYFSTVNEIQRENPEFLAQTAPQAIACANGESATYCIPVMGKWSALAVNTALLERVGAKVPGTWEELLDAARLLSAAGIMPFANPADDSAAIIELLAAAYGGRELLSEGIGGNEYAVNSAWLPALERYAEMCEAKAFAPAALSDEISCFFVPSSSDVSPDGSFGLVASDADLACGYYAGTLGERDVTRALDAVKLFNEGKAAMLMLDSDRLFEVSAEECVMTALPMPGDAPAATLGIAVSYNEGLFISENAFLSPDTRPLVLDFAETLTSAEAGARFGALGYLPVNTATECENAAVAQVWQLLLGSEQWLQTTRTDGNAGFWRRAEKYTAMMQYGLLTPQLAAQLLTQENPDLADYVSIQPVSSGDAVSAK